jgi:hypothetical protein
MGICFTPFFDENFDKSQLKAMALSQKIFRDCILLFSSLLNLVLNGIHFLQEFQSMV